MWKFRIIITLSHKCLSLRIRARITYQGWWCEWDSKHEQWTNPTFIWTHHSLTTKSARNCETGSVQVAPVHVLFKMLIATLISTSYCCNDGCKSNRFGVGHDSWPVHEGCYTGGSGNQQQITWPFRKCMPSSKLRYCFTEKIELLQDVTKVS